MKPLFKGNLSLSAKWYVSLNLSSNLQVNLTLFAKYLYACQSQSIEVEGYGSRSWKCGAPDVPLHEKARLWYMGSKVYQVPAALCWFQI